MRDLEGARLYAAYGGHQQGLDRPLLVQQVTAVLEQVERLTEAPDAGP
jgi:hypothetical protein